MEKKQFLVKFANVSDVLKAGFKPDGGNLRHTNGVSIRQDLFNLYAGRVLSAEPTGVAEFPVTMGNEILPAAMVYLSVREIVIKTAGGAEKTAVLFADGSALLWDGSIIDSTEAAKLAGAVSPDVRG